MILWLVFKNAYDLKIHNHLFMDENVLYGIYLKIIEEEGKWT